MFTEGQSPSAHQAAKPNTWSVLTFYARPVRCA